MTEVTDVIVARRGRREPFNAMLAWSLVAHAVLVGGLLFGPFDWRVEADAPRTVMTINLTAGPPGPRTSATTEGGRAVAPSPPEAVPTAMPPPKPVEKVVPTQTRRTPPAKPKLEEEPRPGVTRTETGARGQGFGLSAGGGNNASGVQLDVANFCCPEYIEQMVTLIQRNWQQNQGVPGKTVMKFTIARGGSIQGVMVERPSGFLALDLAAERALLTTRLPELPPQFPNSSLTVHITFEYQR